MQRYQSIKNEKLNYQIADKMRTLKKWNGRGHGKLSNQHINIAAYSQKQAAELVGEACGYYDTIGITEIREYYSQCWGNSMDGIEPTEPCVYAEKNYTNKPVKIELKSNK